MALQTELLSVLDNSDEPLSKRLRIATDVFNANELPAFNKESVLFNWFGKTCLKTDTVDVWNTLHDCITSSHMQDISTNEIKHNVLSTVVKAIIKQLRKNQGNDFKNNITNCGIAVLNNSMFQQYFKHDLKQYCRLISELLVSVEDINIVKGIIHSNLSFTEKNFDKTEYVSNFLSLTLDELITVLIKFKDRSLFKEAQKLIYRVLITLNPNDILNFITNVYEQGDDSSSNIIFEKLTILYNCETEIAKLGFKIIFLILLSVCSTEILRYRLFVLFLHTVGFKIKKIKLNLPKNEENFNLEKSLDILTEMFDVFYTKNITIKESINEITFSDFLKSLVTSIIRLQTQPNISTLTILKYITFIDPLIIVNSLDEVIGLITLFKKDDNMLFIYSELMISIMKMYFKLRRVGKFYSILFETLQKKTCSKFKVSKPEIKFSGETNSDSTVGVACVVKDVFPENVLQYYQECITLQSNLEVTKILRTCVYNMKQITDDFQYYADDQKVFFVQITSEIICNVLSSVKLGDKSTTELSAKKIVDEMNTLREELKKFGTALLTVEHNHLLMFSFLNICYTWAEVAMLLTFYTNIDNLNFKGEIEHDISVNDLTYLHNYLSAEQWSLVVQRIKNFGEQPCKYVLQKLLIQKLRAVMIFESEVNETIESSIIANYANNLETSWDIILTERFIASSFIPKMETRQLITLSEFLMDHMLKKNNLELLKQRIIIDSRDLMTSMFYVSLSKISDLFKRKRKHGDSVNKKPICTKIFKSIDENSFIKNEAVDVEKISEHFRGDFDEIKNFKINEVSFCTYMEVIKHIPVTSLSHDLQVTLFLYLLSICFDLSKTENVNCLQKCEEYLIALVENHLLSPNLFSYLQSDILVKQIIESVQKYKVLVYHVIRKGLSQNNTIPSCKSLINLLEKNISNEKYLEAIFSSLQVINNASMYTVLEENKIILHKYENKLLKKLNTCIVSNETLTGNNIIAYTLLLEKYLVKDTDDMLAKLIPLLKKHIDFAVNNISDSNAEEFLSLFKSILTKKSEIANVPEDLNKSLWRACITLKNVENYKDFNKILTLVFQDSSDDDFSVILQDLLDINLNYIKNNETSSIQLKIWKNLLNTELSNSKKHTVKNMVQILFANLAVLLANNNTDQEFNTEFVNFQIDMIKHIKVVLSPTIMDVHFQTTQILISKEHTTTEFITAFESGFPILESLANFRKELLIDRLPTFLLHFRLYLHNLCIHSNTDLNLNPTELLKIIDCAFRIEKLTRNVCTMKKDIVRITPYLIADFLKEYEKIALYPDVKHHLNNCLMELVGLCDKHAISYLLRVLSPASTELFKEVHDVYKKFYKFTGKV